VDCGQSLIPRCRPAVANFLQTLQEQSNQVRGHIDHVELVDLFARTRGRERKQQAKGIPVAPLCVAGKVLFGHQIFKEKTPDPWSEKGLVSHDGPPVLHRVQSAGSLRAGVPASW